MNIFSTDIIRLLIAVCIGGLIGAEREYCSKSAGLRTMILVCAGSCLFTLLSQHIGNPNNADRIAANIITGIGFLGAGVIFKDDNRVNGITTATAIWMIAALGMAVGAGYIETACIGSLIMLMVLSAMVYLQNIIGKRNQLRNYRIVCPYMRETLSKYEQLFKDCHLNALRGNQSKVNDEITGHWLVQGSVKNHEKFIQLLLTDAEVREFDF
ncbi:MAG TPA: MgtC/SapB family protein [Panacibacter sp.]|nr:MgtC/SapB family protein [Panacibacter sp.]